jgi:uncharacterized damage-inducible protein DinB
MSLEDVAAAVSGLNDDHAWRALPGIAPLGFHVAHLAGSTDRLLTYARGEALSSAQREALDAERTLTATRPALADLVRAWQRTVDAALAQLAGTPESTLLEAREVGRAKLPSTVLGLLFHAAEHASRHTGQVVTTARIVKSS